LNSTPRNRKIIKLRLGSAESIDMTTANPPTIAIPPIHVQAPRANLPTIVPVGIMVFILTMIISFAYYTSDQWWIGEVIGLVGIALVAVMFFVNERQDKIHQAARGGAWTFDKRFFLVGEISAAVGITLVLAGGASLSGILAGAASLFGVALLIAAFFMIIVSLKS